MKMLAWNEAGVVHTDYAPTMIIYAQDFWVVQKSVLLWQTHLMQMIIFSLQKQVEPLDS